VRGFARSASLLPPGAPADEQQQHDRHREFSEKHPSPPEPGSCPFLFAALRRPFNQLGNPCVSIMPTTAGGRAAVAPSAQIARADSIGRDVRTKSGRLYNAGGRGSRLTPA